MWRKFLGVGIPLAVLGAVFYIIGVVQVASDPWGGDDGGAALTIIGLILMIPGFMLANAGLIGAAIGTEIRGRTQGSIGAGDGWQPTSGQVPVERLTPTNSEPGTNFRGVEGLGAVFIPESGDYASFATLAWGRANRRKYLPAQLKAVELVGDYKTLASIGRNGESTAVLPAELEGRLPSMITSLAVRVDVYDEPAVSNCTIWFYRGKTVESESPEFRGSWAEAIRCFAALGALLSEATQVEKIEEPGVQPCPGCGRTPEPDAVFCGTCGTKLGSK